VFDVHLSNAQPSIKAVQLYLHSVRELATPFQRPTAEVEMAVVQGQESKLQTHNPAVTVELTPQVMQLERLAGVQLRQINWVQMGQNKVLVQVENSFKGQKVGA
jgi:hypothetical protein